MAAREGGTDGRQYRVEALAKGLRVLSCFSPDRPVMRLSELARLAAIPMPTAFRLVATLEGEGYLERLPDGSLRPGTAVLSLGFSALHGGDLAQSAQLPLRDLTRATSQTVSLGVLHGDRVLYLMRIRNAALVTEHIQVGSTLPAVYSSMGKVLLAYAGQDYLDRHIAASSWQGQRGPKAISGLPELIKQLKAIPKRGYLLHDQELAAGMRNAAAPVFNAEHVAVAAVNISVQAAEWTLARMRSELTEPLLATSAEISRRLAAADGVVAY